MRPEHCTLRGRQRLSGQVVVVEPTVPIRSCIAGSTPGHHRGLSRRPIPAGDRICSARSRRAHLFDVASRARLRHEQIGRRTDQRKGVLLCFAVSFPINQGGVHSTFKRREFLKTTAGVAAATSLGSAAPFRRRTQRTK